MDVDAAETVDIQKRQESNKSNSSDSESGDKTQEKIQEPDVKLPIAQEFKERIVVNLSRCNYEVIKKVIKECTNFAISYNDNFYGSEWDLFWQDGAVET